jgi:Glycosyl hydrolases family 25
MAAVQSAQGKDFSAFQRPVTPADLAGLSFAFTRVSDWSGTTMGTDPDFAHDWAAFKTAGLDRGAYWYLLPDVDPVAQARYFFAAVKAAGLEPGNLLVCDSEVLAANADQATHAFCSTLASLAGPANPVLIYTNHNVGLHLTSCTGWPLWFAWPSPTAPPPGLILPWKTWLLWQWGTAGGVDADAFNGTATVLDAWAASHIPAPVPVQGPVTITTDGKKSLAQIAAVAGTQPSTILRLTAIHDGAFSPLLAGFLNGVFHGSVIPGAAVPAGLVLHLP